jgi:hypothetical protein
VLPGPEPQETRVLPGPRGHTRPASLQPTAVAMSAAGPPSDANLRRFPGLATMRPRTVFTYPSQSSIAAAEGDRITAQLRQDSAETAAAWPHSTPEEHRRETGPLAQVRKELAQSTMFPQERSPPVLVSPRSLRRAGQPKPVFSPCNPRQARDAIALPRHVLVNAASPYDAAHVREPPAA